MMVFTKEELIEKLIEIRNMGWIENKRHGNDGGVGNTLEDLLGIQENNLPIANSGEWELKCQRGTTTSLTTLMHFEPSPRVIRFVPQLFLPKYGWSHQKAGIEYPDSEMSFRQTINATHTTDRGFCIIINRLKKRVEVSFDYKAVDNKHREWLAKVEKTVGLSELNPQPYWGFEDLFHKAGTKLIKCFYIKAEVKKEDDRQYFKYSNIQMLSGFTQESMLNAIEKGIVYIDFDARTGHNHGTKFRVKQNFINEFYENVSII